MNPSLLRSQLTFSENMRCERSVAFGADLYTFRKPVGPLATLLTLFLVASGTRRSTCDNGINRYDVSDLRVVRCAIASYLTRFFFVWPVARTKTGLCTPASPALPGLPGRARPSPPAEHTPRTQRTKRIHQFLCVPLASAGAQSDSPSAKTPAPPPAPQGRATLSASRAHPARTQRTRRTHPSLRRTPLRCQHRRNWRRRTPGPFRCISAWSCTYGQDRL